MTARFERMGPDGQYVLQGRQEYYDYNVPIATTMFTLDNEVPADVIRVDQVHARRGAGQGAV